MPTGMPTATPMATPTATRRSKSLSLSWKAGGLRAKLCRLVWGLYHDALGVACLAFRMYVYGWELPDRKYSLQVARCFCDRTAISVGPLVRPGATVCLSPAVLMPLAQPPIVVVRNTLLHLLLLDIRRAQEFAVATPACKPLMCQLLTRLGAKFEVPVLTRDLMAGDTRAPMLSLKEPWSCGNK